MCSPYTTATATDIRDSKHSFRHLHPAERLLEVGQVLKLWFDSPSYKIDMLSNAELHAAVCTDDTTGTRLDIHWRRTV